MKRLRVWIESQLWRLFYGGLLLFAGVMSALVWAMVAALPIMALRQFGIEAPDWALWIAMALGGAWGTGYGHEGVKRQAAIGADLKARFGVQ